MSVTILGKSMKSDVNVQAMIFGEIEHRVN